MLRQMIQNLLISHLIKPFSHLGPKLRIDWWYHIHRNGNPWSVLPILVLVLLLVVLFEELFESEQIIVKELAVVLEGYGGYGWSGFELAGY